MASPRVRKLADRIQVVVAEMLERRVKDPRLGFVTITDVRLTGDGQHATIFYTVLGAEEEMESSAIALESAKGILRSEVAKQLGTRTAPTLTFMHDALPDTARALDEVLARAKALDDAVAAQRGSAYAGESDPYKKPREITDGDDADDADGANEDDSDGAAADGAAAVDDAEALEVSRAPHGPDATGVREDDENA